ncbi:MAG: hypothetical protein JRH20_13190 [Deltaproteobacteria bacterium]|nr:hypothetical protein [Deltaproteobacteria bacterium]
MTFDREALVAKAKQQHAAIRRHKNDPRYARVIGRLIRAGLLSHTHIKPSTQPVSVDDALWVGKWEPRVLELLPAILLKKPKFFVTRGCLPGDIQAVLDGIRHNKAVDTFRGVPAYLYLRWVPRVGHRNKYPSCIKTYRFSHEDMALINDLKQRFPDETEVSIIRRALRELLSSSEA